MLKPCLLFIALSSEMDPLSFIINSCVSGKIKDFVEGDLVSILSSLGENEYLSATEILSKVQLANEPRDLVLIAVGHLSSANTSYKQIYGLAGVKRAFTVLTRELARKKALFTLSIMAICYKYLGEEMLVASTLEEVRQTWLESHDLRRDYTIGELIQNRRSRANYFTAMASIVPTWLNKASWPIMAQVAAGEFPEFEKKDLELLALSLGHSIEL